MERKPIKRCRKPEPVITPPGIEVKERLPLSILKLKEKIKKRIPRI